MRTPGAGPAVSMGDFIKQDLEEIMSTMIREEVIQAIEREKVIVIVRGVEKEKLVPLAEAMYEGGIRLLEITYSATCSPSDEEIAGNIAMLAEHFAGRMYIGAGTVLKPSQAELTARAGGSFIISPDTGRAVIERTRELGLVSIPGALTPTEIQTAHRYGADFVKLFPANVMGIDYIKAVTAPLSHIRLLAVGGVTAENKAEYLKAGACGFGIGSSIINKKMIAEGDFAGITELTKRFLK